LQIEKALDEGTPRRNCAQIANTMSDCESFGIRETRGLNLRPISGYVFRRNTAIREYLEEPLRA
jgi:hypothetical protein